MEQQDSLLEFPCDFPIKVMGAARDDFAQAVAAVRVSRAPRCAPTTAR